MSILPDRSPAVAPSRPSDLTPGEMPVAGEVKAPTFEDVVSREAGFIRRTLSRLGVHENDVNDVAQAVLFGVHRGLSTFDPPLASESDEALRAWIFGICERQSASCRRRSARRPEILTDTEDLDEQQSDRADPEEHRLRLEQRAHVLSLLDRTTSERRAVLTAYDLEDLEMSEVARALAIPVNTAWNRRRLGLLDLRAAWDREVARGARRAELG